MADLKSFFKKSAKLVEPKIEELLKSYVSSKYRELINYQILAGGKRLRPGLAIACCKMVEGKTEDVIYPAAGIEILHNYSLIVDDIIDRSKIRRGQPTCWAKFGKSIAQCVAIDYSAAVFQGAVRCSNPVKMTELLAKTTKTIVEGEILDVLFEQCGREDQPYVKQHRYWEITPRDQRQMAAQKTAFFFRSCCVAGGLCGSADERQLESLKDYGFNLGMAFQVRDDILDIFGKQKVFGKKIGADIIERKLGNIVILSALKELSSQDKEKFLTTIRDKEMTREDFEEAMDLIKKTDARKEAQEVGERYVKKAKESLKSLSQNKWSDILGDLADFVMEREK